MKYNRSMKAFSKSNTPLVSVLVPVYNTERYLDHCLTSLEKQTLRNIEIVVVDDGSTDNSPAIMDSHARRDERIRIIRKPNSGYGDSMNQALAAARGEYVGICEPDDACARRMFSKLLKAARRADADIAKANYSEVADGRAPRLAPIHDGLPYKQPFAPADLPQILLVRPCIWAGIYRRSMLESEGISFTPSPGASFQDASFAHQCWSAAKRAVLLPKGYYLYRIDNEASSSKSGEKVFAVCDEFARSFDFLERTGRLETFGPMLGAMRFAVYIWNYNRILPEHHEAFAQRWAEETEDALARNLLDSSVLPDAYPDLLVELCASPQRFAQNHPGEIEQIPFDLGRLAQH